MENVPEFPLFIPFALNDALTWYQAFYRENKLDPYTDISPANILAWINFNNDLVVSKIDNCVIFKYSNILDNNKINLLPLAEQLTDQVIEKAMQYLKDNNLATELHEVPSVICSALDQTKWKLEDDRANYEYILDTSEQTLLEGNDFYRQRKIVRHFERVHSQDTIDVEYREIDEEIRSMFLQHIKTKPLNNREEAATKNVEEPTAIQNNLELAEAFHKKALVVKINNAVVSLTIFSPLNQEVVAVNHIKVDYAVPEIFRYTIYQLAKKLQENGIKEMNAEQDLGEDGIREFKELLRPVRFLEKKIIKPR